MQNSDHTRKRRPPDDDRNLLLIFRVLVRADSPLHAQGIFPLTLSVGDTMSSATSPTYRLSAWRYLLAHRWAESDIRVPHHPIYARHSLSRSATTRDDTRVSEGLPRFSKEDVDKPHQAKLPSKGESKRFA